MFTLIAYFVSKVLRTSECSFSVILLDLEKQFLEIITDSSNIQSCIDSVISKKRQLTYIFLFLIVTFIPIYFLRYKYFIFLISYLLSYFISGTQFPDICTKCDILNMKNLRKQNLEENQFLFQCYQCLQASSQKIHSPILDSRGVYLSQN